MPGMLRQIVTSSMKQLEAVVTEAERTSDEDERTNPIGMAVDGPSKNCSDVTY